MHPFQYLVNLLNQMLTALFAILLAIWLELRHAHKAKGLTIEEAAELLGIAPVTYSRWERLRQKPHPLHRLLLLHRMRAHQDASAALADASASAPILSPSLRVYA